MQEFFTLIASTSATVRSNDESNGQPNPSPPLDAPTTMDHLSQHHTGTFTLSEYLSCLTTAACFIPTRQMPFSSQTDPTHQKLNTQQHTPTIMITNHSQHRWIRTPSHCCTHTDIMVPTNNTPQTRAWIHHAPKLSMMSYYDQLTKSLKPNSIATRNYIDLSLSLCQTLSFFL